MITWNLHEDTMIAHIHVNYYDDKSHLGKLNQHFINKFSHNLFLLDCL